MATLPTNDLLVIAESDVNLDTTGKPNKWIPSVQIRTKGWDKDQQCAAEHANYWANNHAQYIQYVLDRVEELQTDLVSSVETLETTIEELEAQVEKERVSIGEIIEITGDSTNPSILKGYGTWESFASGVVLVGVGAYTDKNGSTISWDDTTSEGEYYHTMTAAEMYQHSHTRGTMNITGNLYKVSTHRNGSLIEGDGAFSVTASGSEGRGTGDADAGNVKFNAASSWSGATSSVGSTQAFNVMQPTVAVYRWKRVS